MRVFKLSDGTSWTAKLHDAGAGGETPQRAIGWQAVVFQTDPVATAQRLVYRPSGWLETATIEELVAALEEGVVVRTRWGD